MGTEDTYKCMYIYIYIYVYIYMVTPPPRKSTFFMGKRRYHIYIYIYIFRCFGNLDFVLKGEEFDYKGRIEIANQRRGV